MNWRLLPLTPSIVSVTPGTTTPEPDALGGLPPSQPKEDQ
jgi:hypothetical protein